jgi:hypothetical protein
MMSFITDRLLDLSSVALEAFELGRMGLLYLVLSARAVTVHACRRIVHTFMKGVIGDAGIFLARKEQKNPYDCQNKNDKTEDTFHISILSY